VVTLAQSVPQTSVDPATLGGVVGLDFTYDEFEQLVVRHSPCQGQTGANSGSICAVIDSSGYVVYHPALAQRSAAQLENTFVGALDHSVGRTLVDGKFLVAQAYDDYKSQQSCSVFVADTSVLSADGGLTLGNACGAGTLQLAAVAIDNAATNLFVLHLTGWRASASCSAASLPACEPLVALSECADNAPLVDASPRAAPQCAQYQITEDLLEFIREQVCLIRLLIDVCVCVCVCVCEYSFCILLCFRMLMVVCVAV
jgi:hypothetical protein